MTMTFNEISYEHMVEFILPHITIKEVGMLAMVSPEWRDMCSNQEVWKILYLRTIDYLITDESVYIGPDWWRHRRVASAEWHPVPTDLHYRRKAYYEEATWRNVILTNSAPWGCTADDILKYSRIPKDLARKLKSWTALRGLRELEFGVETFGTLDPEEGSSYWIWGETRKDPEEQRIHEENVNKYLDYVEEEWIKHNREKGLSTVNLCQCPNNYEFNTLKLSEKCKNYKDFKKITLKKLMTKAAKEEWKKLKTLNIKKKRFEKIKQMYKMEGCELLLADREWNVASNHHEKLNDFFTSKQTEEKKKEEKAARKAELIRQIRELEME
jgi:hypothetical protein